MNSESQRRRLPRSRRAILTVTGLLVLGGLGYWLTSRHPVPTGPIAEQLRDRTWQVSSPGSVPSDLRLNADGTVRFGGVQDGTWSVGDDRLDLSFAPMPNLDLKARIWAVIHGDAKASFRILELTADSVTMRRLTPDGEETTDDENLTLTLAPP